MSGIHISTEISASPVKVWQELRDISRHVNWMNDAESITFTTDQREGVGTSFVCRTKVGPFVTNDVMTITSWKENVEMGVTHTGLITGSGRFRLKSSAVGTVLEWSEDLTFPWWALGPLGALVARPILVLIWKKNLRNFAKLFGAA